MAYATDSASLTALLLLSATIVASKIVKAIVPSMDGVLSSILFRGVCACQDTLEIYANTNYALTIAAIRTECATLLPVNATVE